jgi:hypothetical protein
MNQLLERPQRWSRKFSCLLFYLLAGFTGAVGSQPAQAIDEALKPPSDSTEAISTVYKDMIVVQRKAKEKRGRYLFQFFVSKNFSDGPKSIYSLNTDFGYALSDHWEVSLNVAPAFILQDQPIRSQVNELQLANGKRADLLSPNPKIQYGVEVLWLPAYGKDSWGPYTIIRSDTFFKLALGVVNYEQGSGNRFSLGVGKTFFLSRFFNPRLSAAFGYQQTIVNNVKSYSQMGLFELGSIWYF